MFFGLPHKHKHVYVYNGECEIVVKDRPIECDRAKTLFTAPNYRAASDKIDAMHEASITAGGPGYIKHVRT